MGELRNVKDLGKEGRVAKSMKKAEMVELGSG